MTPWRHHSLHRPPPPGSPPPPPQPPPPSPPPHPPPPPPPQPPPRVSAPSPPQRPLPCQPRDLSPRPIRQRLDRARRLPAAAGHEAAAVHHEQVRNIMRPVRPINHRPAGIGPHAAG